MVDYNITKEETITEENGIHLKRFEGITEYGKKYAFYEVGVEGEWAETFTHKQSALKYFRSEIAI